MDSTSKTDMTAHVIDIRKLTVPELWRISTSMIVFLVYLFFKCVRIPMFGSPMSASVRTVEFSELPDYVRHRIDSKIAECQKLGFQLAFCEMVEPLGDVEAYLVALLHEDCEIYAQILYVTHHNNVDSPVIISSKTVSDVTLTTADSPRRYNAPPKVEAAYFPNLSIDELTAQHQTRLKNADFEIVKFTNSSLRDHVKDSRQRLNRYNVDRGVYRMLSQEEIDAIKENDE